VPVGACVVGGRAKGVFKPATTLDLRRPSAPMTAVRTTIDT